jgi:SH3 domain protein
VYDGPGTEYEIVGSLEAGESVIVVGRNADSTWWQIIFDGGRAWIADKAVTAGPEAYRVPEIETPSLKEASATPSSLPAAGGGSSLYIGSILLLVYGALLLLAGHRVRQRRC